MVCRGIPQLKNLRLYFCDYGGSSLGVREALQSPELAQYMQKNEHLELEVSLKRNYHPYLASTYINGYVKEQSLRNMSSDEVLFWFNKVNKEFGKRPMKHNGRERLTRGKMSVQGQWHDTMWNQFPRHLMEPKIHIPSVAFTPIPPRPIREKKLRPNKATRTIRRDFAFEDNVTN